MQSYRNSTTLLSTLALLNNFLPIFYFIPTPTDLFLSPSLFYKPRPSWMLSWSAPCRHSPLLLPPLLMASLLFLFIFPLFLVLIFLSFPIHQVSLLLHSSSSHLLLTMAEPTLSLFFSYITWSVFSNRKKKR